MRITGSRAVALSFASLATLAVAGAFPLGCSSVESPPSGGPGLTTGAGGSAASGAGASGATGGATAGGSGGALGVGGGLTGGSAGGPTISIGGAAGTAGMAGGDGEVCATVHASAKLEPVFLVFAFDVSGSMGKGDHPWHDAALKWEPIVSATRGFFEALSSNGLFASLTAFPIDADDDERCDAESYEEPDVPMTALPSDAFGEALDAIREDDWRGGTPTLAVVEGVLVSAAAYRKEHPGRYALVLVTDGYPQDCDDDSIDSVADAVRAVADDVPTYVIGVKNPPLTDDDGNAAPDTVTNLAAVAEAGGTGDAFIIDTGDSAATSAAFQSAIGKIRGSAVTCALDIPKPPDGRAFEQDHVVVSYTSGGIEMELTYDASCAVAGSWHYDDPAAPKAVVLCEATCAAVEMDADAKLAVGFTCEPVINVPR